MKLHTIDTGFFKLDGGAMFGVVPKSIWNKLNPADDNNLCTWAMRCLLIEEGDRLILVDTGMGNKQDAKFFSYYYPSGEDTLMKSIKSKGFSADDITDVILTHLHFDHCGGAVIREGEKLRPTFKNADYWSSKRHWNWAINPNEREKASFMKENILPISESGQLKFIEESELTPFSDNISIRFAYGHTDAMMLPQINYNGKTIVYMADLIPSTGHLAIPYVMSYDMFPLQSMKEKKVFLEEALEKDYILFLEHDPINECCSVERTERGIRAGSTFPLSQV